MRKGTKVATSVAALVTTVIVAGVGWRRSFVAAFRAFQEPALIEPGRAVGPSERSSVESLPNDAWLDERLAADFIEMSGLDLVTGEDARLADLRPNDLPVPITRRALRYVKFFTRDERGRRAFEHLYRRSGRYRERLLAALREARLPEDLLWLAAVESNYDPRATSPATAAGMWQIMPALASDYGLRITPWLDERRSLDRSTAVAVQHLGRLHDTFGAWDLALAAYNMGETGLRDAIAALRQSRQARGGGPGPIGVAQLAQEGLLPAETADYVPKITALAVVAANLPRFRFDRVSPDPELRGSAVSVPSETRLSTLAKAAGVPVARLRELNPELIGDAVPPGGDYVFQVPAPRLSRTLATLPVYLDEAAREAEGLDVLAPAGPDFTGAARLAGLAGSTEPATTGMDAAPEPPYQLMAAWLDALRAQTVLGEPSTLFVDVPGRLGGAVGLTQLGEVRVARVEDRLGLFRPGAWGSARPIDESGARAAAIGDRHLEAALGFLHEPVGQEEPLASGVTLRLERDGSTARVAITVTLGRDLGSDWRRAPLGPEVSRETGGQLRVTEVVRPTEIDVGLNVAVGRLAVLLAQTDEPARAAARASLNRHRRVALGHLERGEAWLALGDLLFPPGDASHGRLIDPRGVDGAWLRDRFILDEESTGRSPADATITVAGRFDPEVARAKAKEAIAALGLGIAGRLPSAPTPTVRRRVVPLDVVRPELLIGQRLPGIDADDHAAALVAMELLAGRQRSLVRGALLEKKLVDAYRADLDPDWGTSVMTLSLTPAPGVEAPVVEEALDRLIERLAEEGPTGIELAYAQTMVRSRLGKSLRASRRAARREGPLDAIRLLEAVRPGRMQAWREGTREVHRGDVQRLIRGAFGADQRAVVEIRPREPVGEVASR